jgi:hypothetical protein
MKIYSLAFIFFLSANICSGQLLKKLGQKVKENAQWRIERTENEKINEGIDSLQALPKKIKNKKKAKANNTANADTEKQNDADNSNAKQSSNNTASNNSLKAPANDDENDMSQKDGFITLNLSANTIFTHGSILISGESVKYKNFNEVEIKVSGPSATDVRKISLNNDGKYFAEWIASEKTGDYTVTVKGSDKKAAQSASFSVEEMELIFDDEWPADNIRLTNKALDKLEEAVAQVEPGLGSKDKAELDKKLSEVKDKVKDVLKLYKDLNTAGKQITQLAKSGKKLSPNLYGNLTQLNNTLNDNAKKMERIEEFANHKPSDNTVCEYLVMLNEACAAFSVYTNIEGLAIKGIIKNIMLDKGVPLAASTINQKANGLSQPNDFVVKEPAKIFSTALIDVEGLNSQLGTAGFAGDIVQFATDFLMKKYCGVFKGSLKHNYTIEFRNSKGENWWTYGVEMKAVLALRYPKEKGNANIIKMKGNIEGNGTKFSFFEDIEKEDGFQEGSKGKIEVVPIKAYTPFSVSQATSELDVLGFGAIARGLATPAYFNIPVDAEYDVNANKIKIFLNPPIIDFSPAVSNQLVFLLIGGDLLPYIKRMSFPINKVFRTLGSVVRDNNEFDVVKDAKGNLSFKGKANKHLGSKADKIEHDLNFTISATKQ